MPIPSTGRIVIDNGLDAIAKNIVMLDLRLAVMLKKLSLIFIFAVASKAENKAGYDSGQLPGQ